jgi:alpha-beta hydrolase superfamily lysophospholipase
MPHRSRPISSLATSSAASAVPIGAQAHPTDSTRVFCTTGETDQPVIAVQHQQARTPPARADVVYVHGSTFGADLSVFFPFDGVSWADRLTEAGFSVWGFDFVGYGASARYPARLDHPAGALDAAVRDLRRVIALVRRHNGDRPSTRATWARWCCSRPS